MIIYIVILTITLLFYYTGKFKNQKRNAFFIMLFMLLVSGLRETNIGIDTQTYIAIFHGKAYKASEIAFWGLMDFFKLFSQNEYYWLLFASISMYLPIYLIIKKESPLPVLSMLIFMISTSRFFPETMNIMRQCLAIPFILLSFIKWNENKKTQSLIYFVIAFLFHNSTIFIFPYYILKKIKFSKSIIYISLIIAVVLGITNSTFFMNKVVDNSQNLNLLFLGDNTSENIKNYSNYATTQEFGLRNWKGYITRFFPLIALCLILIPTKKDSDKYHFYFNILFISIIVFSLLNTVHYGFRIVFGPMLIQILIIPMAYVSGIKNRKRNIDLYIILLIILYIIYLIGLMNSPLNMIVPYESWIFNSK